MTARIRAILLLSFWFTIIGLIGPVLICLGSVTGNENIIYRPVRWFVRAGLKLVGVRVEVEGLERLDPKQTYVFTPNHQSLIEVPLFLTFLGRNIAYLAKKELFKYPVFGWGLRVIGVVAVDRSNTQAAIESARRAARNLKNGKSYVVYPEGTRSLDGQLLKFKKGAFLMAIEAGVPVVPVTVSGGSDVMPKGQLSVNPATIRLRVHGPIETTGLNPESAAELADAVRNQIQSALKPSSGS
jgi:1-acyl-sn-glycerol-3-phosphate acyltransferase